MLMGGSRAHRAPGDHTNRGRGTLRVRLKGDDNDLPRKPPSSGRAPRPRGQDRRSRNDENLIVSQLHVAFLKAITSW